MNHIKLFKLYEQIGKLAILVDEDGQSLSHYNRPIQALNDRNVTYSAGPLGAQ